jgi:GNAT superfamily N-acetyltransferase
MNSEIYKISIKNTDNTKDCSKLVDLINSSYKNEDSWTDKNLEFISRKKKRTNPDEIKEILSDPNKKFFLLSDLNDRPIGSIVLVTECDFEFTKELEPVNHFTFILFAVNPKYQSRGVGKHLLAFAEAYMKLIVETAKGLGLDQFCELCEKLKKMYNYDFDMKLEMENAFDKNFIKEIDYIYIICVEGKKDLCAFYRKYGYVDLNLVIPLRDHFPLEYVMVDSHFTYMKKDLLSLSY